MNWLQPACLPAVGTAGHAAACTRCRSRLLGTEDQDSAALPAPLQGHRHIWTCTSDLGVKELPPDVLPMTTNSTWLQMWGLYKGHPSFGQAAFRPDKVRGWQLGWPVTVTHGFSASATCVMAAWRPGCK
jgi:hypothetical protein